MDIRNTIQIINLILALLAVFPSLKLLQVFFKDGKVLKEDKKKLNKILIMLFVGVAGVTILNAVVALLAIVGQGGVAHIVSPYARSFINLFLLFVSWNLYEFHKQVNDD